ncbi:MAG: hypothetical protein RIQ70_800 [Bacteroidota bacterium]|jgi:hypothetical protein
MKGNIIKKHAVSTLGYGFVKVAFLTEEQDEYFFRNLQNRSGIAYRHLNAYEIEVLVRNRNTSDDWNKILVSDAFTPELVKNCKFYGLVRIGKLEPYFLEFSDLKVPVGLYNSTIISCDFGDNVVVDNVNYMSHYIVGSEVIIVNVNELVTTDYAKFGNGILKEGENESTRVWLEICNENGGRSIIPFIGMLPGDAYLWSKYRDDQELLDKFKAFTAKKFDAKRGYYGKIGDRTVVKNCNIIKDVWIGTDAYLKGANKIKNITINSSPEAKSQIGEGCELVNGIIEEGCRVFYGVKAVRFFMASHSQLKYGARLINSYLGNNAVISCCEVLNTLIFPAHEQHHNNSFLCASLIMGQSNIAAGATIGSNHNSRSPDGEIIAGRGFWPGLCVSLKHNSKFASFTIIAKGNYPAELDIQLPFTLVCNNESTDRLVLVPAYWFKYNMYALARNCWKYLDRDKRIERIQQIEYDYLAPDSINEMFAGLNIMEESVGNAYLLKYNPVNETRKPAEIGKELLCNQNPFVDELEVLLENHENAKRKVQLTKVSQGYTIFNKMIVYYGINELVKFSKTTEFTSFTQLFSVFSNMSGRGEWLNIGGQLIPKNSVNELRNKIRSGELNAWEDVHEFYTHQGSTYSQQRLFHAFASILELKSCSLNALSADMLIALIDEAILTKEWMTANIYESRAKDYHNPFRKMVYDNALEMEAVMGSLEDNSFIQQQREEFIQFQLACKTLKNKLVYVDIV